MITTNSDNTTILRSIIFEVSNEIFRSSFEGDIANINNKSIFYAFRERNTGLARLGFFFRLSFTFAGFRLSTFSFSFGSASAART